MVVSPASHQDDRGQSQQGMRPEVERREQNDDQDDGLPVQEVDGITLQAEVAGTGWTCFASADFPGLQVLHFTFESAPLNLKRHIDWRAWFPAPALLNASINGFSTKI